LKKDLPRDLERIILRCLRKDPARRFQVMADLAVELDEIKTESGTRIAPTAGLAKTRDRRRLVGVAVGVALAAAAATAWFLQSARTPSAPTSNMIPLTAFPGDEQSPSLSPDGNQVVFSWTGEQQNNEDIYVMPIGSGTPVRLTSDSAVDRTPAWSPNGTQIAFARIESVNQVAIYLATPPVPNSERKLATVLPIVDNFVYTDVSWFPDGRRLVIAARESDGQTNGIVAIGVDSGESQSVVRSPVSAGRYRYPRVSPTGDALAYALCTANFTCDTYVVDLDANRTAKGQARRLTETNSIVTGIAWTPDGRSLIYGSEAGYIAFLWRVSVGGTPPERVDAAGELATNPSMSSRGNLLAYERNNANPELWKFEVGHAHETIASSTRRELNPQFSPDGKRIAFESNRLGKLQIFVANADGTNAKALNGGNNQGSPRWSPDNRSIVYDAQLPAGQRGVLYSDADGGPEHFVTSPGNVPSWSPDGRWIYFSKADAIWRIAKEGGSPVQIAPGGNNSVEGPDGTLYYRKASAPGILFAMPAAGGPERQILTTMVPSVHRFFPVADGIYFIARPQADQPFSYELQFFEFASGKSKTLDRINARLLSGLSVSPNRKTFLYSGTNPSDGDDLMLIRNFR